MHNKRWKATIACVLAGLLIITGCSTTKNNQGPKAATLAAQNKLTLAESYEFHKTIQLKEFSTNLFLSDTLEESDWIFSFLNNSEITINGIFQKEPLRMEMTLDFNSQNESPIHMQIPIIVTKDKTYVEIPELPEMSFPPHEVAGKYVEITNGQNNGQTDQTIISKAIADLDEETYFNEAFPRSIILPPIVDANQIFTFAVTKETFDKLAFVLIKNVLPDLLDLVSTKPAYQFLLDKDKITGLKKVLSEVEETTLKSWIQGLKKSFNLNDFHVTTAINKAGDLRFQETIANLAYLNGNDFLKLDMIYTEQYSKMNEPVQFTMGLPTNVIQVAELDEILDKLDYKHDKLNENKIWNK